LLTRFPIRERVDYYNAEQLQNHRRALGAAIEHRDPIRKGHGNRPAQPAARRASRTISSSAFGITHR